MRVLLVYSNRTRILEPAPPIGLSYVATATRRAGHDVRLLDLMVSGNPLREMRAALEEFEPEVVGISVRNIDNLIPQRLSRHLGEVDDLIGATREHGEVPIVLGGPAISILAGAALERLDADFAVVGEGEDAFPRLLAALAQPDRPPAFAAIPGLCYREGDRILTVPPRRRESFGESGMADWINWPAYERAGGTWAIHTKRGCPLTCLYCNYPAMEGQQLRLRSATEIVDEIEEVMRTAGPRTFEFTDSTFNVPESHAVGICEEVIRRNLRVNLSAVGVNPLAVSEKLFVLMKCAGFISMVITPDSASEAMLRNLRKGFRLEHVRRAAELARASNIRTTWFFLLGGPGETHGTVEETISFVETHLNWERFLTIVMTGVRILPGTEMARLAVAEGRIKPDHDLCNPTFYFSPEIDESWVLNRINQAIARCPGIVHGAEESDSRMQRIFHRALSMLGVAPPHWRFLPTILRFPLLAALRARDAGVRASSTSHRNEIPAMEQS